MVKLIRYLLFPFSLLYGGIVAFRNMLFNKNVMKSSEFDVKTIQIGNLSAGGTGKTPHTEYLIRLLKDKYKIATLSRGYGRKTTGFIAANKSSTAREIGDEPLQFATKFQDVKVFVDAKRVNGIIEIMSKESPPEIVLLDDAYQHRSIKAGFSILLTDYNSPFFSDFMLPTGNLREFPSGKRRADVIVVTKCPEALTLEKQQNIENKIKPDLHQAVFFSRIKYGALKSIWDNKPVELSENQSVVLISGIANSKPLVHEISSKHKIVKHFNYPDHHSFTEKNVDSILEFYQNNKDVILITTEKDAMRLKSHEKLINLPIYFLEIEIELISKQEEFNNLILDYARTN